MQTIADLAGSGKLRISIGCIVKLDEVIALIGDLEAGRRAKGKACHAVRSGTIEAPGSRRSPTGRKLPGPDRGAGNVTVCFLCCIADGRKTRVTVRNGSQAEVGDGPEAGQNLTLSDECIAFIHSRRTTFVINGLMSVLL